MIDLVDHRSLVIDVVAPSQVDSVVGIKGRRAAQIGPTVEEVVDANQDVGGTLRCGRSIQAWFQQYIKNIHQY